MSHSAELFADAVLDASGLNCPEPVMMLHNKVRGLEGGELLKVIATDPSTQRDIPKFASSSVMNWSNSKPKKAPISIGFARRPTDAFARALNRFVGWVCNPSNHMHGGRNAS